ncbi:hypothetical protein SAMN05877838_3801 [Hoeflea halophila]|uniref:Uncharacterized protein n=1 Tax=Hoeflea halophila TaxID=714899 RepID=A0A286IFQ4_9HYPH|nr:hypothetical protein SAMN05877838_3801 [Hoeflea halophila]
MSEMQPDHYVSRRESLTIPHGKVSNYQSGVDKCQYRW